MWQMPDWLDYKMTLECQMRFGAWVSVLSTSVSLVLMFDRQEDADEKKKAISSLSCQLPFILLEDDLKSRCLCM